MIIVNFIIMLRRESIGDKAPVFFVTDLVDNLSHKNVNLVILEERQLAERRRRSSLELSEAELKRRNSLNSVTSLDVPKTGTHDEEKGTGRALLAEKVIKPSE